MFLILVLVASLFALPVSAAEDPRFETSVPEPELQPGAQQPLTVTITNDAEDVDDQVKQASNVKVTARSGSTPIEVLSGEHALGQLADGQSATGTFQIEVPTDAPGGTYQLPLDVTYEYDGDEREETTVTATVTVPERPIFSIESTTVDLHTQETGIVTVALSNDGAQSATDTRISLSSSNAALTVGNVATESAFLGTLESGATAEATFAVTATETALAREYDLTIQPTYQNSNGITTEAPARSIGIAPAAEPRITVDSVSGDVSPGETGTVSLTFENSGETGISNARLQLESAGSSLTLDGGQATAQMLGDWAAGETKTVHTEIGAATSVQAGEYPVQATVAFEHPAGIETTSGPQEIGVPVTAIDAFAYSDVSVTHHGPEAVLSAQVTYEGETPIQNAVVLLRSSTPGVTILDGATSVGTLEPGDTATATADISLFGSDQAPQQFEAQVRYEGEGAQADRSESTSVWADLSTSEPLFSVEPVNATFDIDSSNELRVRIRNDGPLALEDVRAQLTATPPYQSQSPTAYVAALDPGDSAIVTFEVTTPDDGVETTDALSLNLTAETNADRTVVDGPHLVPITVDGGGDTTGDSTLIAVLAVVVILILAGGWWWLNR
ncbi:MAG: hypothetical protein V5A26_08990 [Halodesulfurarchaeum sp.]|uniref:COG1361 S-layer family protein n=1 Tax=Halodesulfurarchaeum sp. TaxID=1980530 RepID=UPI002FC3142E